MTSSYAVPDFSTTVCSGATFTYTATITPNPNGEVTFPTGGPTTFDYSTSSTVKTYIVTLKGTIAQNGATVTSTFNIVITNGCAAALLTAAPTASLSYVIASPVPTIGTSSFTVTPAGCAVTYAYKFHNNATTLGPGNALFTFPTPGQVQVGVSSDPSFVTAAGTPY